MQAKVKKLKLGGNDGFGGNLKEELAANFNATFMSDRVDMTIAWPRYLKLCEMMREYRELHRELETCSLLRAAEMVQDADSVKDHGKAIDEYIGHFCGWDLAKYDMCWSELPVDIHKTFHDAYDLMKKHNLLRSMFKSLGDLTDFKEKIKDENISPQNRIHSIVAITGVDWAPFPHKFNIGRATTIVGVGKNTYKWLMGFINQFYVQTINIWKHVREPDIDVDEFVRTIVVSLEQLGKIPELSRCKLALRKVRESMDKFKENFSGYYQNFIDTGDSTSMLHEFVVDVSRDNGTADPETVRQFNVLMTFTRKQIELRKQNDPSLAAQLSKFEQTMNRAESVVDSKIAASMSAPAQPPPANRPRPSAAAAAANPHSDPALQGLSADQLAEFIESDKPARRPRK